MIADIGEARRAEPARDVWRAYSSAVEEPYSLRKQLYLVSPPKICRFSPNILFLTSTPLS